MLAEDADRRVDLAHHDRDAVSHVARIDLDDVGPHVARRGETGAIVENPAIARMRRVPGLLARTLRQRIFAIVHRQIAVAVDRGAKHHSRIARQQRLLNWRQHLLEGGEKPACGAAPDRSLRSRRNCCRTNPPRVSFPASTSFSSVCEMSFATLTARAMISRFSSRIEQACVPAPRARPNSCRGIRDAAERGAVGDANPRGADAVDLGLQDGARRDRRAYRRGEPACRLRKDRRSGRESCPRRFASSTPISQGRRSCRRRSPASLWRRKIVTRILSFSASAMTCCPFCSTDFPCALAPAGRVADLRRARWTRRRQSAGSRWHCARRPLSRRSAARPRLQLAANSGRMTLIDVVDLLDRRKAGRGVALQRIDLLRDLFGRLLRLARKLFHFGSDDREAASGLAGARSLDRRIERQQIGLPRHRRDET